MPRQTQPLTIREWEQLRIDKGDLTENEADAFHELAQSIATRTPRLRSGETGNDILIRTRTGLRARQIVGTLVLPGGRTMEILPKIDGGEDSTVRKALVHMLAMARKLPITEGDLARFDTQHHDLLEILIELFANRLRTAVLRGLPRRYLEHEDDLKMLRGKLNITRQVTLLAARPDRLACRFDELSEDTPLNRVLKAAVVRLLHLTRSANNARLLNELLSHFDFVSDATNPLGERVRLDRSNTSFHVLYNLARLFLAGSWQSTAGGSESGFSLLFAMNDLFEAFIGNCLKRALAPRTVRLQGWGHYVLRDDDGDLFALNPDAVIEDVDDGGTGESAQGSIIVDTKWKALDPNDRKCGVAQSDIYQMTAYQRAYLTDRVVLIYPWHSQDGPCRNWNIAGTNARLDIRTIDVSRPREAIDAIRDIFPAHHSQQGQASPVPNG